MRILYLIAALFLLGCGDKIPEDDGGVDIEQICDDCFEEGCKECTTEPCEECEDCEQCKICEPPRCFEKVEIWKGNPDEGHRFKEIPCEGVLQ